MAEYKEQDPKEVANILETVRNEYILLESTDLEKEFGFNTLEILKDR